MTYLQPSTSIKKITQMYEDDKSSTWHLCTYKLFIKKLTLTQISLVYQSVTVNTCRLLAIETIVTVYCGSSRWVQLWAVGLGVEGGHRGELGGDLLAGVVTQEQGVGVAHRDLGNVETVHTSHLLRSSCWLVDVASTLEFCWNTRLYIIVRWLWRYETGFLF